MSVYFTKMCEGNVKRIPFSKFCGNRGPLNPVVIRVSTKTGRLANLTPAPRISFQKMLRGGAGAPSQSRRANGIQITRLTRGYETTPTRRPTARHSRSFPNVTSRDPESDRNLASSLRRRKGVSAFRREPRRAASYTDGGAIPWCGLGRLVGHAVTPRSSAADFCRVTRAAAAVATLMRALREQWTQNASLHLQASQPQGRSADLPRISSKVERLFLGGAVDSSTNGPPLCSETLTW